MSRLESRACSRPAALARGALRAFSLLELVVVLAILSILVMLFLRVASPNAATMQLKNCQKNLQRLFIAIEIYATDHQGTFPARAGARSAGEALDALVPRYTADTTAFVCPAAEVAPPPSAESIAKHKISFAYYMGRTKGPAVEVLSSDAQVDATAKRAGVQVFSLTGAAPGNNHGKLGGNFLFTDGHAESTPARAPFSLVFTQGVVLLNP